MPTFIDAVNRSRVVISIWITLVVAKSKSNRHASRLLTHIAAWVDKRWYGIHVHLANCHSSDEWNIDAKLAFCLKAYSYTFMRDASLQQLQCEAYLAHDNVLSSSTEVEQSWLVLFWFHVSKSGVCPAFHQSNRTNITWSHHALYRMVQKVAYNQVHLFEMIMTKS